MTPVIALYFSVCVCVCVCVWYTNVSMFMQNVTHKFSGNISKRQGKTKKRLNGFRIWSTGTFLCIAFVFYAVTQTNSTASPFELSAFVENINCQKYTKHDLCIWISFIPDNVGINMDDWYVGGGSQSVKLRSDETTLSTDTVRSCDRTFNVLYCLLLLQLMRLWQSR